MKLFQDSHQAYECLRYLSPITPNWTLIKYDPSYRHKAEQIFKLGKVNISVEQLLNRWSVLEKRYYQTDTLLNEKTGNVVNPLENPENIFYQYKRKATISIFEFFVKAWCCQDKFRNYWHNKKYGRQMKDYWLPLSPDWAKSSSTLSGEVYPPVDWYFKIKEIEISDEDIKETYIDDFKNRLKYEFEEREKNKKELVRDPQKVELNFVKTKFIKIKKFALNEL